MELKELTDKIQNIWEQMKAKNDEVLDEAKKLGEERVEDRKTWEKMSADFDEQKKRLDEVAVKLARNDILLPGQTTESEENKARKAAFFKYIREGKQALVPDEKKALVEDATGLYLVPEELEKEIVRDIPQINVLRNYCRVRPTSRDKVAIRSLTEVSVGWGKLETGTEITSTEQTPSKDTIYVEDLYALSKIGEDELMDTDTNLTAILADSFSVALADAEAEAFAIGQGHTTYSEPTGITNETLSHCDWNVADTVDLDSMLEAEYSLGTQYLKGSIWLMNRKTELAARQLRAEVADGYYGNYLWQPSLVAGAPNNFDGYPVINQNDMSYPADGTDDMQVIFGNFKLGYMILDRMGMSVQRLSELYAEEGLVGFKVHRRVGGGAYRTDAFYAIGNALT